MTSDNTFKNYDDLYPGRFLKGGQMSEPTTFTIAGFEHETLEGKDGEQKQKVILHFAEAGALPHVMPKTNGICLREMFGKSVPDWVGKRVTLFCGSWNGEDCVRVWGSPDIAQDMRIVIQHPKKKPLPMVMHAMRAAATKAPPRQSSVTPPHVAAYFSRMADAQQVGDLVPILDAIAEDNSLSPEDTERLGRGIARRQDQLRASAPGDSQV